VDGVFRRLNREVWVVTAADTDRRGGLLATYVSQASLDPAAPMVLIGIAANHFTRDLIDASQGFAVHLLCPDQTDVALNFAIGSGRDRDKLANLSVRRGATGAPLLRECLAWMECRVGGAYDAGDRIYYWADVTDGQALSEDAPLCEHELMAAASEEQLQALRANLAHDIQVQRPMIEAWRRRAGS
ncbi:MAG: flavin reductase family protein, partial [Planctomycetales bacterium]|nr:flavin reductase family protein [Planctomycetales bacterium]NIM09157.1 flavin reductase family protein [Planctomycetales bacterium]NIN08624.1 flavin reductase family protein [Planctomycetales bacterium]NIN77750.1 flavin reductase family protein [Planctomycetales bacterium]NIO34926.1 flavin reductase family protein [Planctomycetales bacterium]